MASADSFTLMALPNTDIWRKPPTTNAFNAATHEGKTLSLAGFKSARITFSASYVQQYDQAGLVINMEHSSGQQQNKWLKAGIEFYKGKPFLGIVGCDRWSDWSIAPPSEWKDGGEVTVEMRREGVENGRGLWVYQLLFDEVGNVRDRVPLREVCWFFADEDGWDIKVAGYAARPSKDGTDGLEVKFSGFDVQTQD